MKGDRAFDPSDVEIDRLVNRIRETGGAIIAPLGDVVTREHHHHLNKSYYLDEEATARAQRERRWIIALLGLVVLLVGMDIAVTVHTSSRATSAAAEEIAAARRDVEQLRALVQLEREMTKAAWVDRFGLGVSTQEVLERARAREDEER